MGEEPFREAGVGLAAAYGGSSIWIPVVGTVVIGIALVVMLVRHKKEK